MQPFRITVQAHPPICHQYTTIWVEVQKQWIDAAGCGTNMKMTIKMVREISSVLLLLLMVISHCLERVSWTSEINPSKCHAMYYDPEKTLVELHQTLRSYRIREASRPSITQLMDFLVLNSDRGFLYNLTFFISYHFLISSLC